MALLVKVRGRRDQNEEKKGVDDESSDLGVQTFLSDIIAIYRVNAGNFEWWVCSYYIPLCMSILPLPLPLPTPTGGHPSLP
jgi:hypothetical protein